MKTLKQKKTRSHCPIATTLEVLGDRWTLILVRDMITGKTKFKEFLSSPEKITTNVLTDRLVKMEAAGLIRKKPYQKHPLRYQHLLTPKAKALLPVLQEMCRWANYHMPETWVPPESFMKNSPDNID